MDYNDERFCRNCAYCVWDDYGEGLTYGCELEKKEFDYDDGYCEEYCRADQVREKYTRFNEKQIHFLKGGTYHDN